MRGSHGAYVRVAEVSIVELYGINGVQVEGTLEEDSAFLDEELVVAGPDAPLVHLVEDARDRGPVAVPADGELIGIKWMVGINGVVGVVGHVDVEASDFRKESRDLPSDTTIRCGEVRGEPVISCYRGVRVD